MAPALVEDLCQEPMSKVPACVDRSSILKSLQSMDQVEGAWHGVEIHCSLAAVVAKVHTAVH